MQSIRPVISRLVIDVAVPAASATGAPPRLTGSAGFDTLFAKPLDPACPLCGEVTTLDSRQSVVVHYRFHGAEPLSLVVWAHPACVQLHPELAHDSGAS